MKQIVIRGLLLALSAGWGWRWAHCEEMPIAGTTSGSANMNPHRWGGYVGLGNPYPTLLGLNAAYQVDSHIRVTAGYGEIEVTTSFAFNGSEFVSEKVKAQTYALGADYLFREDGLRPLMGAKVGYFQVSGKGDFSVQGISKSTELIYSNLGVDYLTDTGWDFGAGLNVALVGGKGANFYANVGHFF